MKSLAILLPALALAVILTLRLVGSAPGLKPEAAPDFTPDLALAPEMDPTSAGLSTPRQMANGARVYRSLCAACHLPDGRGFPGAVPPLVNADFLRADRVRAIRVLLHGLNGPITVNGISYNNVMPPLEAVLSDAQVADVLTYVFNSWGNTGDAFDPDFVTQVRAQPR